MYNLQVLSGRVNAISPGTYERSHSYCRSPGMRIQHYCPEEPQLWFFCRLFNEELQCAVLMVQMIYIHICIYIYTFMYIHIYVIYIYTMLLWRGSVCNEAKVILGENEIPDKRSMCVCISWRIKHIGNYDELSTAN